MLLNSFGACALAVAAALHQTMGTWYSDHPHRNSPVRPGLLQRTVLDERDLYSAVPLNLYCAGVGELEAALMDSRTCRSHLCWAARFSHH